MRWRRDDKESIVCYFLFMALYVSDFSGLALVFPVVLYCYALLAQPPARSFWQASHCPLSACLRQRYIPACGHVGVMAKSSVQILKNSC